jgi:hypothetical protein
MSNPWLSVPLSDYEGHMSSADVQQLTALSDLFNQALMLRCPASVAILGVAGGNGLDHIDPTCTKRILGIDFNPSYLETTRARYAALPGLQLHCLDLSTGVVTLAPVDLVHAALVFEHAGVEQCLENAVTLVAAKGALSVVLQLPSTSEAGVSPTPFPSMQTLKSHFTLIDPAWFRKTMESRGFRLTHEFRRTLPAGKSFWLALFSRS